MNKHVRSSLKMYLNPRTFSRSAQIYNKNNNSISFNPTYFIMTAIFSKHNSNLHKISQCHICILYDTGRFWYCIYLA